jgi:hypothetical protein
VTVSALEHILPVAFIADALAIKLSGPKLVFIVPALLCKAKLAAPAFVYVRAPLPILFEAFTPAEDETLVIVI